MVKPKLKDPEKGQRPLRAFGFGSTQSGSHLSDSRVDSKLESAHDRGGEEDLDDAVSEHDSVDGGAHKATREGSFMTPPGARENRDPFPVDDGSDDSDWERQADAEYSEEEGDYFFADKSLSDDQTTRKVSASPIPYLYEFNASAAWVSLSREVPPCVSSDICFRNLVLVLQLSLCLSARFGFSVLDTTFQPLGTTSSRDGSQVLTGFKFRRLSHGIQQYNIHETAGSRLIQMEKKWASLQLQTSLKAVGASLRSTIELSQLFLPAKSLQFLSFSTP